MDTTIVLAAGQKVVSRSSAVPQDNHACGHATDQALAEDPSSPESGQCFADSSMLANLPCPSGPQTMNQIGQIHGVRTDNTKEKGLH